MQFLLCCKHLQQLGPDLSLPHTWGNMPWKSVRGTRATWQEDLIVRTAKYIVKAMPAPLVLVLLS